MPTVVGSAHWVAAQRARESERTDRLFFDPIGSCSIGQEGMAALQLSEKYNPRHIPAAGRTILSNAHCAVTLGDIVEEAAGMDARAYRISWPDGTRLDEIDRSELVAAKEEILQAQPRAPECRRIAIGGDLTQD